MYLEIKEVERGKFVFLFKENHVASSRFRIHSFRGNNGSVKYIYLLWKYLCTVVLVSSGYNKSLDDAALCHCDFILFYWLLSVNVFSCLNKISLFFFFFLSLCVAVTAGIYIYTYKTIYIRFTIRNWIGHAKEWSSIFLIDKWKKQLPTTSNSYRRT